MSETLNARGRFRIFDSVRIDALYWWKYAIAYKTSFNRLDKRPQSKTHSVCSMVANGADFHEGIRVACLRKTRRRGFSFNKNYQVRILWMSKKENLIVFSKVLPSWFCLILLLFGACFFCRAIGERSSLLLHGFIDHIIRGCLGFFAGWFQERLGFWDAIMC